MKSDVYVIGTHADKIEKALGGIEKVGEFSGLNEKSARTLRLLAEEMVAMISGVLKKTQSELWLENQGDSYELHLLTSATVGILEKDELIAVSSRKKNEASKGLLGKLSDFYEDMVITAGDASPNHYNMGASGIMGGFYDSTAMLEWSLRTYEAQYQPVPKDELEKSIIMQLADDVLMSVKSRRVEMIVKKSFKRD